jgi:hypothetical protein
MTTVIPFLPSNIKTPTFGATFDGDDYKVTITWNISAQRYYVNVYGSDGSWIIATPLIQSPPSRAVNGLTYDPLRRVMTIQMVDPKYWPVPIGSTGTATPPGTIVDYTLENFDPALLNTKWRSLHVNDTTFSFPLANDPGQINILGSVGRHLDMLNGIFQTSSLIYRNGAFEVNP